MSRMIRVKLALLTVMIFGMQWVGVGNAAEKVSPGVSSESLDESIDKVISRPEYSWRLPREVVEDSELGLMGKFLEKLRDWLIEVVGFVYRVLSRISEYLDDLFKRDSHPSGDGIKDWQSPIRTLVKSIVVILCVLLSILLYKAWKKRRAVPGYATAEPVAKPIRELLEDDNAAWGLPSDEWLRAASDFMAEGDFRMAMRAMFFACLVHLAHAECISIAKYKSNRDYTRELHRRAHDRVKMVTAFDTNVRMLESVWYGTHQATMDMASSFSTNKDRIFNES